MKVFRMLNGELKLMAPEEGEDGDATGAPADTDTGSESESEFEDIAESFESGSYDDEEAEEGSDDSESESEDETAADSEDDADGDDRDSEEEDDDADADESEGREEEGEEDADEEDEDEGEEKPEPLTDEQIEEARNQYIEKMSEQFQISEEEADALRTEPEKVMPKLMAKAMTSALEQMAGVMRNNLPQLVDTRLTQQTKAQEINSKFFGKYPELQSKKAMKVTEQMARAYRQANPDADLEETMDNVAFMAWKKLGLSMDTLSERMNGAKAEEFNKSSTSGKKGKGGFKPAQAGRTGEEREPRREKPSNEFEEIANLLQNDSIFDD